MKKRIYKKLKDTCKKTKRKRNRFNKNLTKCVVKDSLKKIPLIESVINAREETEKQLNEEKKESIMKSIENNTKQTNKSVGKMLQAVPILNPDSSIKKLSCVLDMLNRELTNNPDFNIRLRRSEDGKEEIIISPKKGNLNFKATFNMTIKELGHNLDFNKYINDKIKNGESVSFKAEQIVDFVIDHPQFNDYNKPTEIIVKPSLLDKPRFFHFKVNRANVAYYNVKMAPIHRDSEGGTLISLNLPFKIVLRLNKDLKGKINFSINERKLRILDLNKFYNFVHAIKDQELHILDARTDKLMVKLGCNPLIELDSNWISLIEKIAKIDEFFNLDLMCPEKIDFSDLDLIDDLIEIINNKCLKKTFKNFKWSIKSSEFSNFMNLYKEKSCFDNIKIRSKCGHVLFGKKINLGECELKFPPLKILEDIAYLEKEAQKNPSVSMTLIPLDDNICFHDFNCS